MGSVTLVVNPHDGSRRARGGRPDFRYRMSLMIRICEYDELLAEVEMIDGKLRVVGRGPYIERSVCASSWARP
jgi:hypothetical protein